MLHSHLEMDAELHPNAAETPLGTEKEYDPSVAAPVHDAHSVAEI